MTRPSTVPALLRFRAAETPDRVGYTYLVDGRAAELHFTYGELQRRARVVASALQAMGARGERVLLLYPPGLDYVAGFFGCLLAGAVAVPAYPPYHESQVARIAAIVPDWARRSP